MTKQELKDIVDYFRTLDYSTFMKALMVYESIGTDYYYESRMEEMDENDLNYLTELYRFYLKSDIQLINFEELKEQFEDYKNYASGKESDINA